MSPSGPWPLEDRYEARSAVYWWAPSELLSAGVRAVLAKTFGDYADRRETLAALTPHVRPETGASPEVRAFGASAFAPKGDVADFMVFDATGAPASEGARAAVAGGGEGEAESDYWFDYVADIGDGFGATYSVAEALAHDRLSVGGMTLERGDLLVMGGDEVYPTPSTEQYHNRTVGPYATASQAMDATPDLYAIPGNHDWYDGLTSFIDLFCSERRLGAWRTRQYRSYFSVRLPHHWWLWGLDAAFETRIDRPQMDYFSRAAALLQPGDGVIICTAKPTWLYCAPRDGQLDDAAYFLLRDFVSDTVEGTGAEVRLILAGDKHAYARYAEIEDGAAVDNGLQKIIAGGGGAYLADPTGFARTLRIRETRDTPPTEFTRVATYPSPAETRRLYWTGLYRLPQAWGFVAMVGVLYVLLAYFTRLVVSVSAGLGWDEGVDVIGGEGFVGAFGDVLTDALTFPPTYLLAGLLFVGLSGLAREHQGGKALEYVLGAGHTVAHLAAAAVTTTLALITAAWLDRFPEIAFFVVALAIGAVLGTLVFTLYLIVASHLGRNQNELFIGIRWPGFKNFLRLRIQPDGTLRVYAVGLRRVGRRRLHWTADGRPTVRGQPAEPELIDSVSLSRSPGG